MPFMTQARPMLCARSRGSWALVLLLAVGSGGCSGYFAGMAKEFGGTLTSPSGDLGSMLRGISQLCRRQADLSYLRSRIEDPTDKHLVPFSDRLTSKYGGRMESIEARCMELDKEVNIYQLMQGTLLYYGNSLRALADSENLDFRDSFQLLGTSLGRLAVSVNPQEPELQRVLFEGVDAINKLLRAAINAKTEADIKKAILAAALPVRHILARMELARGVYNDQVIRYMDTSRTVLAEVERATLPPQPGTIGRSFDVISFYEMALRTDEEQLRLKATIQSYQLTLTSIKSAHDRMVEAANNRVPAKEAFRALRMLANDLAYNLGVISDQLNYLHLRGLL